MGFFTACVRHKKNNEPKKLTRTILTRTVYKIAFYNGYTNAKLCTMSLYDKDEFEAIKQDLSAHIGKNRVLVTKDGAVNLKFFSFAAFSESVEDYYEDAENVENCD